MFAYVLGEHVYFLSQDPVSHPKQDPQTLGSELSLETVYSRLFAGTMLSVMITAKWNPCVAKWNSLSISGVQK